MNEKQHSIPQNIMSIQFKLIGNMSMRQFLIIATPLFIGFIMYVIKISNYITVPFTAIFLLSALAIAFVPLDDRPLDEWITNFIVAIRNPTQRIWKKNEVVPNILKIDKPSVSKTNNKKDIAMFLYQSPFDNSLNSVNEDAVDNALDVKEKTLIANIDKINSMISSGSTSASVPTKTLGSDLFQQESHSSGVGSSVPSPSPISGNSAQNGDFKETTPIEDLVSPIIPESPTPKTSNDRDKDSEDSKIPQYNPFNISNITPVSAAEEVKAAGNPNIREDFLNTGIQQEASVPGQMENPFQDIINQINPQNTSSSKVISQEQTTESETMPSGDTPEIKAPSVVLNGGTKDDNDSQSPDLSQNTSSNTQVEPPPEFQTGTTANSENNSREEELNKILTRIQSLEEENQKLKSELAGQSVSTEQAESKVSNLSPKETPVQTQEPVQEPVQEQIAESTQTQTVIQKGDNNPAQENPNQASQDQSISLTRQQLIDHLPEFTKVPNVVAGVVITGDGKILNNAIVIIKDTNQKPVRAVKTNQLGQFFTRTPLPSGRYDIEVDAAGYKFNTATIELNNQVIPPFMFIPTSEGEQKNISGM